MRRPVLILFPGLVLGTAESAGVISRFRPLLGPGESRGGVATSDFIPTLGNGDPQECTGDVAFPPSCGPREKAKVR